MNKDNLMIVKYCDDSDTATTGMDSLLSGLILITVIQSTATKRFKH